MKMPRELKEAIFFTLKAELLGENDSISASKLRPYLDIMEELVLDEQAAGELPTMVRIMEDQDLLQQISDALVTIVPPTEAEEVSAKVIAYCEHVWRASKKRPSAEVLQFPRNDQ